MDVTQRTLKQTGWLSLPVPGLGTLHMRATLIDGNWRATEIYLDGGGAPIQAAALRGLPLASLEQAYSNDAALFAEHFPDSEFPVPGDDVRGVLPPPKKKLPPAERYVGPGGFYFGSKYQPQVPAAAPVLSYDGAEGLTDALLSDVGRVYAWAVANRMPPAKAIAEQAGVSQRTAQAWIYKARNRKLMPPARSKGRIV